MNFEFWIVEPLKMYMLISLGYLIRLYEEKKEEWEHENKD